MKRYYVCKVIGDGLEPETAFRPAIADIVDPKTGQPAFSYSVVIGNDAAGRPTKDWCLVLAAGKDHRLVAGSPDIDALPDYPLDAKMSAMHAPTRSAAVAKLQARGIDTSRFANADGYRELVRALGQDQDPSFHEDKFDVSDV